VSKTQTKEKKKKEEEEEEEAALNSLGIALCM
jgi:hypothetical protein